MNGKQTHFFVARENVKSFGEKTITSHTSSDRVLTASQVNISIACPRTRRAGEHCPRSAPPHLQRGVDLRSDQAAVGWP